MILDRLKSETKVEHKALEKVLNLQREDLNLEDYKKILSGLYEVHSTLEKRVLDFSPKLDLTGRFKSSKLKDDLDYFKVSASADCKLIPEIKNMNQLLGYVYVLEGSTLGGMMLAPYFKKKFDLDVGQGLSYYFGYGENTMRMWKEFQGILVENVTNPQDETETVESAREIFNILSAVFSR